MNDALPGAARSPPLALLSNNHPQPTENVMKKITKKTVRKSATPATKQAADGSPTPASNEMNAQLRKKYEVIRELVVTSDVGTIKARCAIGHHVVQVMEDENKYGKKGVKQLALALHRDTDTLYDCVKVAKLLATEPFKELSREGSINGLPLSFSHWLVLAKADERIREQLTRQALNEGLSVRELKAEAEPGITAPKPSGVARLSTALTSTKSKLDESIEAVVAELSANDLSAERLGDGRRLVGLLREVRDAADKGIEELEQALESASTAPLREPEPRGSVASNPAFLQLSGA
jgi:hypothetical protein